MMSQRVLYMTLALVSLAACSGMQKQTEIRMNDSAVRAENMLKNVGNMKSSPAEKAPSSVAYEEGIWLGKNAVKTSQAVLPPIFYEEAAFDRTVQSLSELAERLTMRSGIPTKISSDALSIANSIAASSVVTSAASSGAVPASSMNPATAGAGTMAAGGQFSGNNTKPRTAIRIMYANGSFKGLLDTVAARFGVSWQYSNGVIQFYHTDARTFQIHALPGDSTFSAAVTSGASSSGGGTNSGSGGQAHGVASNNSQNIALNSQLSVYGSIEKTISAMVSAYGKVVASPATGSITVVDTPDSLERIAAYVESENKSLSRQISINVTVLAVTLEDSDDYGIKWDLVYQGLQSKYGLINTVSKPSGSVFSAGILQTAGSKLSGSSLVIQALSEQGKVRRETTASVVTLNNQPVPVQVAKQSSYLQSSQTTLTAQIGATTSLTPGTVTSGFNMSILPHVLNNGTVMLQFTTDISALKGFRTVSSNGNSIETPEVETRNFLQRVAMKSNETLIISGFEQTSDNLNQNGVGTAGNMLLGGQYKASSNKEIIVILITPNTVGKS